MSETMLNLYDYQQNAVETFWNNGRKGSFIFATGTGKTEVAIGIIKRFQEEFPNGKTVFVVPRIVLIDQTAQRLEKYGVSSTSYYGENKDLSGNVVVSTYQSFCKIEELEALIVQMLSFHEKVLFVFDEVHLAGDQASNYVNIMKSAMTFDQKDVFMLALTATINENDMERYGTILTACPVLERIHMGSAIENGFLSKVKVVDSGTFLTEENTAEYERLSQSFQRIFELLGTANPTEILKWRFRGDYEKKNAAWGYLKLVQKKAKIFNLDENKISKAVEKINEVTGKTLLFTERVMALERINEVVNDPSVFSFIEAKTPKKVRKQIIQDFADGKIKVLGTVHTLDIGFDQKDVANCIFMASNKNENQLIQRLGRGVRKSEGKEYAMIYVIYGKGTSESELMDMITEATNKGRETVIVRSRI